MGNYYLAVDIGASSGRHILGSVEQGKIVLEEIHRFENGMVKKDGHRCWDTEQVLRVPASVTVLFYHTVLKAMHLFQNDLSVFHRA